MSKRPIVSYDDIVPTNSPHAGPSVTPQQQERFSAGPYPKKRKRSNPRNGRQYGRGAEPQRHVQHWDDPGSAVQPMPYDDESSVSMTTQVILEPEEEGQEEVNEGEEGEESRELTHDEIWDDSVLIEAWESAAAEYEAFHGTDQSWKNEPVKKSPLWYNIPPPPSKLKKSPQKPETNVAPEVDADDSQPINFEGFVPHHDASLTSSSAIIPRVPSIDGDQLATAPEGSVSQDEAFNRALGAMYWAGYWTAVYHGHKKQPGASAPSNEGEEEDKDQEPGEADDVDDATVEEELISTQR